VRKCKWGKLFGLKVDKPPKKRRRKRRKTEGGERERERESK
jgi:hypothetical protein